MFFGRTTSSAGIFRRNGAYRKATQTRAARAATRMTRRALLAVAVPRSPSSYGKNELAAINKGAISLKESAADKASHHLVFLRRRRSANNGRQLTKILAEAIESNGSSKHLSAAAP